MRVLRTPDSRFADLPGYQFASQYVEIDEGGSHFLQEDRDEAVAEVVAAFIARNRYELVP